MLSARYVIAAAIALVILSITGACVVLLTESPDEGGWGRNTYGVRADGLRAIHDTLAELGATVERPLIPTLNMDEVDAAYVLWSPLEYLVQAEPAHLEHIAAWLKAGGRLVVTRTNADDLVSRTRAAAPPEREPTNLLAEIGLPDVKIEDAAAAPKGEEVEPAADSGGFRPFRQIAGRWVQAPDTAVRYVPVTCHGDFAAWQGIEKVCLPANESGTLLYGARQPQGRVTYVDEDGKEQTLAARFQVGKGEVTIVATPALAGNALLARQDNAVLVAHLMTAGQSRVMFDEFYHGLTIRGNVMWLFTQRPFAAMALALLAVVGCVIWRRAVFLGPPQADAPVSRRSISEYVEAMSRFFLRGRQSSRFVLKEMRSGVLWLLGDAFGLPPDSEDPERVRAALARTDPQRARQLDQAIAAADAALADPRPSEASILASLQKVNACLSN